MDYIEWIFGIIGFFLISLIGYFFFKKKINHKNRKINHENKNLAKLEVYDMEISEWSEGIRKTKPKHPFSK